MKIKENSITEKLETVINKELTDLSYHYQSHKSIDENLNKE